MTYIPDSKRETQYNELVTAERIHHIDLSSIYGTTALRDVQTVTGSATITTSGGEYRLQNTASGTDSADLRSAERGKYVSGQQAEYGIGVRIPVDPTGNQVARWGAFDADNGFGFGADATGVFTFRRKATTDTKVYATSWNVDTLDGTGPSGLTLDITDGLIYQIEFNWYGYGSIIYKILMPKADGSSTLITVHKVRVLGEPSVVNPNQPICAIIDNATTATAFDMYVGGRQFSTFSQNVLHFRITSQYRLAQAPSTTFIPAISFRRKSGSLESARVRVEGFDVTTDTNLICQLRLNAGLTNASYGTPSDHTASETALEVDTSATAISGGEVVWSSLVNVTGGGNNQSGSDRTSLVEFDVPVTQPATLCFRTTTGTATRVESVLRMSEEW